MMMSGDRFSSSNDENVCPPEDLRRKTSHLRNIPPTKRIALSTINENVAAAVTKPSGNLKVSAKQEQCKQSVSNFLSNTVSQSVSLPTNSLQTFRIYEDDDDEKKSKSPPQSVISLYKADQENEMSYQDQSASDDSCMVLDVSLERPRLREDYLLCPQYTDSIYLHLRSLEEKFRASPNYMKKQPDITLSMRSVLVDWLVEVAEEYKMQTETLYLAVSYTDRFLSVMSVLRCKLQLVGTASMYIAAKYEEIYPPELREFVYITDDTYNKKQVLRMEHLILKVLAFDLSAPTAYTFLQNFCTISDVPEKVCHLAEYLCELTLLEAQPFLLYLPSEIACAALCLANCTLGREPWSSKLKDCTGYSIENFRECLENLLVSHSKVDTYPHQAVKDKYKSSRYSHASEISPIDRLELEC